MIEKYRRIITSNEKNIAAKDALKFWNSLKTKCSEEIVAALLEHYVERWIEITDRSGLVKANEEFYSLFLIFEEVARSFMTVDLLRKNQKEDIKEIFKVNLKTVPELSVIWVSLSRKMPNRQLSNKLFEQVIEKSIDSRAYAYVISFVEIMKRKSNSLTKKMKKVYSKEPIKKSRANI